MFGDLLCQLVSISHTRQAVHVSSCHHPRMAWLCSHGLMPRSRWKRRLWLPRHPQTNGAATGGMRGDWSRGDTAASYAMADLWRMAGCGKSGMTFERGGLRSDE